MNLMKFFELLSFAFVFLILIPCAMCILHYRKNAWFRGRRMFFWILAYSALSWCLINGIWYVRYLFGWQEIRGPEAGFALFFGWLYLWMTSIPVFTIYGLLRMMFPLLKQIKDVEDLDRLRSSQKK